VRGHLIDPLKTFVIPRLRDGNGPFFGALSANYRAAQQRPCSLGKGISFVHTSPVDKLRRKLQIEPLVETNL